MQSSIYAFILSFFLVFSWFVHAICSGSYYVLEIKEPPTPYGPPQVFVRSGSDIVNVRLFGEYFSSKPSPGFLDKYAIFKGSVDEVRVLSNLPPDQIDKISARLADVNGKTITRWDHGAFQPTSLEVTKEAQLQDGKVEDAYAHAVKLETEAWKAPAEEPKLWLNLLVAQCILGTLFYAIFRWVPVYRNPMRRMHRMLTQTPSLMRDISPFAMLGSSFLAVTCFSVFIWIFLGTYYGTVDDPLMTLIVKGYMMAHPDWHLFFIHPTVGLFLVELYQAIPHVPWYMVLMSSLKLLSLTAIAYAVMRRSLSWYRIIVAGIIVAVSGVYLIACFQFTMVSIMTCFAGVALVLGNAGQASISRARLIAAVCFFLAGAAVRIQPALLMIALFSPCFLYCWYMSSLPGAKRFALMVGAGLILLIVSEEASYQISPEWKEARSYDSVRGKLHETEMMKKYQPSKDVFEAVGWSKNDLQMFNWFLYEDDHVYSKDKLAYLTTHLHLPPISMMGAVWRILVNAQRDIYALKLYLLGVLVFLVWGLMPRMQTLILAVPCLVILSFLAIAVHLPERVICPVMFIELMMLLLLADFHHRKIHPRSALFGGIFIVLLVVPFMYDSLKGICLYSWYSARRQDSTVESLNYLSTRDMPIIVGSTSETLADQTYLWQDFPQLNKLRVLQLFWFQSPVYQQRLDHLGIHDVFSDLAYRSDMVFAVTRWDLPQVTCLETFLKEHHGIDVKFEVAKIPGTDQDAVFPFFSLFKAKIISAAPAGSSSTPVH